MATARVCARRASDAVAVSWARWRSDWQRVRFVARSGLIAEQGQRLSALGALQALRIVWAFALPWRLPLRLAASAPNSALPCWAPSQTKTVWLRAARTMRRQLRSAAWPLAR
jgi:hypothetical protein